MEHNSKSQINVVRNKYTSDISRKKKTGVEDKKPVLHQVLESVKKSGVGKILVIIANGPSKAEADLQKLLKNPHIDLMTVNEPDLRVWPTKYWIYCDLVKHRRVIDYWEKYDGILFNPRSITDHKLNTGTFQALSGSGFSLDVHNGVYIGNSSTYAAMQVAEWMGYDDVYIFGCDMGVVDGKLYEWGSNPDVVDNVRVSRFDGEAKSYQWLVDNNAVLARKFCICSLYNKYKFVAGMRRLDQKLAVDHILSSFNKG